MVIKNNLGKEKEVKLILEVNYNHHNYLIYEDDVTKKIYSGKKIGEKITPVDTKEKDFLEALLERIES